ncbi:MAG: pyridoxal-phosphate dependent enzyme [Flavobacteriales bacterium]|nr:pyridoxal-phosphate dependent enzyme [Flavobacteriales bacterium]
MSSRLHEVKFVQKDRPVVSFSVLREDEIHPIVSGNKWRKLKYPLLKAKKNGTEVLVTFGGAYSNHIAATAFAAKVSGLRSIGLIRGHELQVENSTLKTAQENGMQLQFVDRSAYRENKQKLIEDLGLKEAFMVIPEGGASLLGVKGCEEILDERMEKYTHISCSAGTGTMAAGLLKSLRSGQVLEVYSALKGHFLWQDIEKMAGINADRLRLTDAYCFGGYAKTDDALFSFMRAFYDQTGIPLDPVYTAKFFYGVIQDMYEGTLPKEGRVLAIHSGGLQGIAGIEKRDEVTLFDI